ncbi:teneurin-4-like [Mya arenaria]|uniref:teneurin-4-like n=1 Tax=Mya arenaria TaxID=6604 RepID=UPI0022DEE11E|nr:teneurin-4-like [Mya arenaria]
MDQSINIFAPTTHDCGHHGHWNDRHNYCECSSGYSGSKCEIAPITHDCGQHGVWSNTGHHCVCSLGYSGSKCETYLLCGGHGFPFDGYSCTCDVGWSGETCTTLDIAEPPSTTTTTATTTTTSTPPTTTPRPTTSTKTVPTTAASNQTDTGEPSFICNNHGSWDGSSCHCFSDWIGATCWEPSSTPTTVTTTTASTTTRPTTVAFTGHACNITQVNVDITSGTSSDNPAAFVCPYTSSHSSHEAFVLDHCTTLSSDPSSWAIGKQL